MSIAQDVLPAEVLQERVRRLEALLGRCADVLVWASGSPDFNHGGQARVGWDKLARPLLAELIEERFG